MSADVRRNCWSCRHASKETTACDADWSVVRQWVTETHLPTLLSPIPSEMRCPPDADGCPGWEANPINHPETTTMPTKPVTPFQHVVNTFRAWERAIYSDHNSADPEARESEFRVAMGAFLATLPPAGQPPLVNSEVRWKILRDDEVEARGEIRDPYVVDLARLLAEGWTTIDRLESEERYGNTENIMVLSRPATPEETETVLAEQRERAVRIAAEQLARNEALERAEYERLKAKFEGGAR